MWGGSTGGGGRTQRVDAEGRFETQGPNRGKQANTNRTDKQTGRLATKQTWFTGRLADRHQQTDRRTDRRRRADGQTDKPTDGQRFGVKDAANNDQLDLKSDNKSGGLATRRHAFGNNTRSFLTI
jgi:hypothetical protein